MDKIAIIIPTINRDDLLIKTLHSIIDVWQDNWRVYIIDQNPQESYGLEKKILYSTVCTKAHSNATQFFKVIEVPYDCGLSHCRNVGVLNAMLDGIEYCLITADSIKFNDSMKDINRLTRYLNYSKSFDIDLLGLNLKNRNVGWEAWLDLKDSFILDFIDKSSHKNVVTPDIYMTIWKCDIVRNFFLATTRSLLEVRWDVNLKMMEHEDFFWQYKNAGYNVGWTLFCHGEYIGKKEGEYKRLREKNMRESKNYLYKKYNLKNWVTYKNLDRAKNQAD